ncbi:cell division protein FtsQ [Flavobacterium sp.]|uniref:cell division protein FtsQ/DivIB n=1 Tax=Flavobacterium sp. TaxID=239 RepID=UPI00262B7F40|nr:cell division protein FtsQ [Flavobacterium sp.]MDD3004829.1 cell division protein FtsQ [Flavobacterium sp.]
MKKFKFKNIWLNVRLLLMIGLIVFLYSFTSKRNDARKTKKTIVEFVNNSELFINHQTVNKLLIENSGDLKTIGKDKVVLNKLEKKLNEHDMIQKAEVFVSIDGVLKAIVTQRTPIARVFNEEGSFYIDSQGNKMPLSDIQSARLPLVLGEINEKNEKEIYELLWLIYKDDFLKKNITGIEILPSGSLRMTTRNYNYEIEFGRTIEVKRKFDNYKAFFQKAIQDTTINQYKVINLKFTQQVVCTK